MNGSPSLRPAVPEVLGVACAKAREDAAEETGSADSVFGGLPLYPGTGAVADVAAEPMRL